MHGFALLASAFCLAALVTSEPFCEEDEETTLLHAQKVLKPNANSSEGPRFSAARLLALESNFSGSIALQELKNRTSVWAASMVQLTQSERAKLSAAYGSGLTMVLSFALAAFFCSCCAIMALRNFIEEPEKPPLAFPGTDALRRLRERYRNPRTPPGTSQGQRGAGAAGAAGAAPPPESLDPPWRVVVVDAPLPGDRLGVMLAEDSLVVTEITDPRAAGFGFQVGERVVHINGVPVFQQADFEKVLTGAMRDFHVTGRPITLSTVDATSNASKPDLAKESRDGVCGKWKLSNGEVFFISQMPGVDRLMLTMLAGSVPAASGLLVPEANGPDLRCLLFRTDGSECGEVQISIGNGSGLEAAFRANTSASFGPTLQANRVPGEFPSRASLTPMPRTFDSASNRPSMTPPTLPPHSRPPTQL
ncbi:unnamed protein product [Effrenium voratum]|nr:unnamed protein product [Effrenium voratum]